MLASDMAPPETSDFSSSFLQNALKQEILNKLMMQKANACPMGVHLAWHLAGTFDKLDGTGGTNGATMHFESKANDAANAGLGIAQDMLLPVKHKYPNMSVVDIWALTGAAAIEHSRQS